MKAIVVDTIALCHLEIASPRGYIHRHMSRQREHTGIVLASQEGLMSVHIELLPTLVEMDKAKLLGSHFLGTHKPCFQSVEVRMELAPRLCFIHFHAYLHSSCVFLRLLRNNSHVFAYTIHDGETNRFSCTHSIRQSKNGFHFSRLYIGQYFLE